MESHAAILSLMLFALMSTAGFLPVTLWNNKMLALYPRLLVSCLYALLNVCEYTIAPSGGVG